MRPLGAWVVRRLVREMRDEAMICGGYEAHVMRQWARTLEGALSAPVKARARGSWFGRAKR